MSDGKIHKPKQDRGKKKKIAMILKISDIDEDLLDNIQIAYSSW